MSAHYSKYALNTYNWTPYFQAFVPAGYPVDAVLRKSRAFRRLPPNLRSLAEHAKEWAEANNPPASQIDNWYDPQGNELDPDTGRRLTDAEIDAQWEDDPDIINLAVGDIPLPVGGFPDPATWKPPTILAAPPLSAPDKLQILDDVAARGVAATEALYGISLSVTKPSEPAGLSYDEAKRQFSSRASKVLGSSYFNNRAEERRMVQHALRSADTHDDLWGQPERVFDRAEEYEMAKDSLK